MIWNVTPLGILYLIELSKLDIHLFYAALFRLAISVITYFSKVKTPHRIRQK